MVIPSQQQTTNKQHFHRFLTFHRLREQKPFEGKHKRQFLWKKECVGMVVQILLAGGANNSDLTFLDTRACFNAHTVITSKRTCPPQIMSSVIFLRSSIEV